MVNSALLSVLSFLKTEEIDRLFTLEDNTEKFKNFIGTFYKAKLLKTSDWYKTRFLMKEIESKNTLIAAEFENILKSYEKGTPLEDFNYDNIDPLDTLVLPYDEEEEGILPAIQFYRLFAKMNIDGEYDNEEFVRDFLGIEEKDIRDNKMYQRYKKKRLEEYTAYLCEDNLDGVIEFLSFSIFSFFDEPMECKYQKIDDVIPINLPVINKEIGLVHVDESEENNVLYKVYKALSPIFQVLREDLDEIPDEIELEILVEKAIDHCLIANLKNFILIDEKASISTFIRNAVIDDFELFTAQIVSCVLLEMCFSDNIAKNILIAFNQYEDKKIEININDNTEELEKTQKELEKIKKDFEIFKSNHAKKEDEVNKEIEKRIKTAISAQENEVAELNKKYKKLETENLELKENLNELNALRNLIFREENEVIEEINLESIDLNIFKDKRYVFVGGRFELLNKLGTIFEKSKFYRDKMPTVLDVQKIEKIIIFPKNISHEIYYKAIDYAKLNNVPILFTNATNFERAIEDFYHDYKETNI